jgi:hypothetical protein
MRMTARLRSRTALSRWLVFGMLCGVVGAACFIDRFPLLQG